MSTTIPCQGQVQMEIKGNLAILRVRMSFTVRLGSMADRKADSSSNTPATTSDRESVKNQRV